MNWLYSRFLASRVLSTNNIVRTSRMLASVRRHGRYSCVLAVGRWR